MQTQATQDLLVLIHGGLRSRTRPTVITTERPHIPGFGCR